MEKLLIINPGSTSTKIAVYEEETPLFVETIEHTAQDLAPFETIISQYEMRKNMIEQTLLYKKFDLKELTAIVSRGGLLPPIKTGAYAINEDMVWQLTNAPANEHASNLGAVIAHALSQELGQIPCYIYDGVTADELLDINRVTGLPTMERKGMGHNLNIRAAAKKYAREMKKEYQDITVLVAHLGGGITIALSSEGQLIDMINDEEGPFSPERAGGLPIFQVISEATTQGESKQSMMKKVKTQGGLMGYFGVNDVRIIEQKIEEGDTKAKLIYDAMALNIAKNIAKLAVNVNGKIDHIILTGGIAYSKKFTKAIQERVEFIAPVLLYPGENEMESLAFGGLRVLRGEENVKHFTRILPIS